MADIWIRSDKYHNSFLIPEDKALESALANSKAQGLPEIAVSAAQGKYLYLLIKSIGAKRVLEVGTLGGYAPFHSIITITTYEFSSPDTPQSGSPKHFPRMVNS